jgi:hypothetical protein
MLHAIRFLGALCVVETVKRANQIASDTTDTLELHALTNENVFI